MNFIKILDTLSNEELLSKRGSRRDSFTNIKNIGKGVALASIPFGLAATSSRANAATAATMSFMAEPNAILNFALTLEYLENEFYQMGLDANGLIPAADRVIFAQISKHEKAHVDFLKAALGDMAVAKPAFDFTAGGTLDPFNDYPTFMALAQGFEDTGVRAYKGQAVDLAVSNDLLDYGLQIHSVEARHASQVRRMRGERGWITGNITTLPEGFKAIYAGEQNTMQGGVELSGDFGAFGGNDALTQAFDEPLTMDQVNAIAGPFIVK